MNTENDQKMRNKLHWLQMKVLFWDLEGLTVVMFQEWQSNSFVSEDIGARLPFPLETKGALQATI